MNARPRLATVWLDGCSGCHMSVLDLDERLLELLADRAELVYSPLVDRKDYPDGVDVCLVEGAVSTTDDLRRIHEVRARTRILVALGDCAVTANVPSMRNPIGPGPLLARAYAENVAGPRRGPPAAGVPELLPRSEPVHRVVAVDVFMPGCPPSADRIHHVLDELLAGRLPSPEHARFGA
jgi:NAD-reducing hydrogenase small subunit